MFRLLSISRRTYKSLSRNLIISPTIICLQCFTSRDYCQTATQNAEQEMSSAFHEMKQADVLMKRRAFVEAEQLYSRVLQIVSSFSPENSPMVDVVNRKLVEVYMNQGMTLKLNETMSKMKRNVDSRGDKQEAIIERIAFATMNLHLGDLIQCGINCKELDSLCSPDTPDLYVHAKLISFLQQHLEGKEAMQDKVLQLFNNPSCSNPYHQILTLNNAIGMMWDNDAVKEPTIALCRQVKQVVEGLDSPTTLTTENHNSIRTSLNNAGAYLLFQNQIDDGGALIKYSLQMSDAAGINPNHSITTSNTLALLASILLKQDQPVTSEGLFLQALDVFQRREKTLGVKTFSRPELFDYSKACDGYAQLLLKWDKRERLGEQYQTKAVELLMSMNENTDWLFPLTSRFWTPPLFNWSV